MTRRAAAAAALCAAAVALVAWRGAAAPTHGPPGHGPPGHESAAPAHGEHGGHDPSAAPANINWVWGLLGEHGGVLHRIFGSGAEGETPDLFFRRPGDPPPVLAGLINLGILAYAAVRWGRKPLADALRRRKDDILREMRDAARIREEAEKRLAGWQEKLDRLDDDIARLRREMSEAASREHDRILLEAQQRRDRMHKDAELLVDQELKQARADLRRAVVDAAMAAAMEALTKRLTPIDQDRLADAHLAQVAAAWRRPSVPPPPPGRPGAAS